MFDIGFAELLLLAVISLLVLGPERLPAAVRFAGLWLGRIRRSFAQVKTELERELNTAELKQERHNRSIMQQLDETRDDMSDNLEQVRGSLHDLEYQLDPDRTAPERQSPAQAGKDPDTSP